MSFGWEKRAFIKVIRFFRDLQGLVHTIVEDPGHDASGAGLACPCEDWTMAKRDGQWRD